MERVSAFMDGEAGPAETQQAMLRLKEDAQFQEVWASYHLIGDVMRGDSLLRDDFMARFNARLAEEPTQLAPRRIPLRKYASYGLSAAASLSAVAIVLALVYSDNPLAPKPAQIAQVPAAANPAPTGPVAMRPSPAMHMQGKVNEYLMAHQEYSPSTALQGVAPYVRTVSETHDGNNR